MSEPDTVGEPTLVDDEADSMTIPPRFWWLKRVLAVAAVLLVGLLCLRFWWGWEAHRRLQAEIDKYIAAGQPIYPEDFDPEPVPDAQNAAVLFEQAAKAVISVTDDGVAVDDFWLERQACIDGLGQLERLVEANEQALGLARQARARPEVSWDWSISHIGPVTHFSAQRSLQKMLWLSAMYHFDSGDHREAVETIFDMLVHSEAVDSHPTVIASLVAWAGYDLAFSVIEDTGAGLQIDESPSGGDPWRRTANRVQVQKLSAKLLGEDNSRRSLIQSSYGDRACQLEFLDSFDQFGWTAVRGMSPQRLRLWDRVVNWLQRPLLVLDTVRSVRLCTTLSGAAREASWPGAVTHFPIKHERPSLLLSLTRPVTGTPFGSMNEANSRILRMYFKHLARRRMAATALAIRLYVVEHGRRPKMLVELVPEYLPQVPVDPFSADGADIRYKSGAGRAIFYSVAADGEDNDGVRIRRADGRLDMPRGDILFYLDGEPMEDGSADSQPSHQASDNDEDQED